jgi:MFS family permease
VRGILTPQFLLAALANFLFFTGLAAFFLLPLHLQALGASEARIGLTMGGYSAVAIVFQPVVGAWVDRAARRPFLLAGAALTAAASASFAIAPDALWLFPWLRVLQGLAFSVYFVANVTLVVDLVPPARRGEALGIFGISGLSSTALGPALGELVIQAAGFRVFFLATGLVALLATLVSARLAEPPRGLPPPTGERGLGAVVQGLRAAPRLPMALGLAFGLGLGVVFTFFPTYAAQLGVQRIGLFAVAYSVAALAVRAFGGRLVDTLGRRAVILPALGLQAGGTLLLAALGLLVTRAGVPALPLFALAGLLAGTAHGFLYPALTALVMDLTPGDRRGRILGVFSAAILTGQATGAIGFGALAHLTGYGGMFLLLTGLLAGACALAFRLER